jgi:hypothetical protein
MIADVVIANMLRTARQDLDAALRLANRIQESTQIRQVGRIPDEGLCAALAMPAQ